MKKTAGSKVIVYCDMEACIHCDGTVEESGYCTIDKLLISGWNAHNEYGKCESMELRKGDQKCTQKKK